MTDLPNKDHLIDAETTEAQFQGALSDLYDYVAELLGGAVPQNITISTDSITPTSTHMIVDTEDDLTTDNLRNIVATNIGSKLIMVRCESSARVVTLKHLSGGSGQLYLHNTVDLALDNPQKFVVFEYNTVLSRWEELYRNWGIFAPSTGDRAAARAVLGIGNANIWTGTATGSGTAHTVTTGGNLTAYTGIEISYVSPSNITGPLTVNVDGIGPVSFKRNGQNLVAGDVLSGDTVRGYFNGTNLESLLPVRISDSNATGDMIPTFAATPRAGFIFLQGQSLGKDGSGAGLTGATYQALYYFIWNNLTNAAAPVSGGRGASAVADWDAGKIITLPDPRHGKGFVGAGTGYTLGTTGGSPTKTIGIVNLPDHFHAAGSLTTNSAGEHQHEEGYASNSVQPAPKFGTSGQSHTRRFFGGNDALGNLPLTSLAGGHAHTITGQTAGTGGGTPLDVMNPWVAVNIMIKL